MAISTRNDPVSSLLKRRTPAIPSREWLRTACLALIVVLGSAAVARQGAAMFVSPPEKKVAAPAPTTNAGDTQPKEEPPSPKVSREDIRLQREIQEIKAVPARKRNVNSNTFSRISGRTEKLKPVAIPASSIRRTQAPPPAINDPFNPAQTIFAIGSWAFILACVGAAAIGLLKIRKLTSSE